jgi:hypothetical protein
MADAAETFQLDSGAALIDVRGGGFDIVLLIGGQPIALNWCDCGGSVAQYIARAGQANCEKELNSLRHTLSGNWSYDVPISSQILQFLKLLVPGRYQLDYVQSRPDCDLIEFDSKWDFATRHDSYYPFDTILVFTQASDALDVERVNHFVRCIRAGDRPIVLTVTADEGWCDFVVDGHHKLQAYKLLGVAPTFVRVCRLDAPNQTADSFAAYIGESHPMSSHYRDVKTKHDRDVSSDRPESIAPE